MSWFEIFLRRWLIVRELGWPEIKETFSRFIVIKTRWFSIYIHKLDAPITHPLCHDHPWHFWTFVLGDGYWEDMNGERVWRGAGSVLYRTARSLHNTTTRAGKPNWSIIIVSRKVRDWAKRTCDAMPTIPVESHWLTAKTGE